MLLIKISTCQFHSSFGATLLSKGGCMKIFGVRFSCIIIALFLFTGCNTSPVEQVKNGTLNDNKSTTIGKSFDNYQYFISPEWKYFETEQGKKIVQFEATVDISSSLNMFKPYAEAIKLKTEILNEESKEKKDIMEKEYKSKNLDSLFQKLLIEQSQFFEHGGDVVSGIDNLNIQEKILKFMVGTSSDTMVKAMNYIINGDINDGYKTKIIIQFTLNMDDTFYMNFIGVNINGNEFTYNSSNEINNIYTNKPLDITYGIAFIAFINECEIISQPK